MTALCAVTSPPSAYENTSLRTRQRFVHSKQVLSFAFRIRRLAGVNA